MADTNLYRKSASELMFTCACGHTENVSVVAASSESMDTWRCPSCGRPMPHVEGVHDG